MWIDLTKLPAHRDPICTLRSRAPTRLTHLTDAPSRQQQKEDRCHQDAERRPQGVIESGAPVTTSRQRRVNAQPRCSHRKHVTLDDRRRKTRAAALITSRALKKWNLCLKCRVNSLPRTQNTMSALSSAQNRTGQEVRPRQGAGGQEGACLGRSARESAVRAQLLKTLPHQPLPGRLGCSPAPQSHASRLGLCTWMGPWGVFTLGYATRKGSDISRVQDSALNSENSWKDTPSSRVKLSETKNQNGRLIRGLCNPSFDIELQVGRRPLREGQASAPANPPPPQPRGDQSGDGRSPSPSTRWGQ